MSKPKVAFYWCASCGGCEETVVDLAENILAVVEAVDIVLWPVALDFKKKDIEAMEDGSITVAFVNGAIRTSEQEEWAKLLRNKSQLLVAFGACAQLGGIPGLANFTDRAEIFKTSYHELPSVENTEAVEPQTQTTVEGGVLTLPTVFDRVRTLRQAVAVDYYLPGCPPSPDGVLGAVGAILSGKLPPKGAILSPNKAQCEDCPRKDSKPERMELSAFKRVGTSTPDPAKCLLAEGYLCLGPATRQGCREACIRANVPCSGCFGPLDGVRDQGAAFLSALGSLIPYQGEAKLQALVDSLPDPAGTFYRYSLPSSLLGGKAKRGGS